MQYKPRAPLERYGRIEITNERLSHGRWTNDETKPIQLMMGWVVCQLFSESDLSISLIRTLVSCYFFFRAIFFFSFDFASEIVAHLKREWQRKDGRQHTEASHTRVTNGEQMWWCVRAFHSRRPIKKCADAIRLPLNKQAQWQRLVRYGTATKSEWEI